MVYIIEADVSPVVRTVHWIDTTDQKDGGIF